MNDYPSRTTCPYCNDYAAANVHDMMAHMAERCPVEKAPVQNLEQSIETGEGFDRMKKQKDPFERGAKPWPYGYPEVIGVMEDDEDACFAGHYESELRTDRYGKKEDSYNRVAQYWADYLYDHPYEGLLDEEDVALMMALFKLARWQETGKFDHLYDMKKYVEEAYHRAAKTFSRGF